MKDVTIRQLRSSGSEALFSEELTVTSHGRPIGTYKPRPGQGREGVEQLLQMDGVEWNGGKPKGGRKLAKIKSGKTIADYVVEGRGD